MMEVLVFLAEHASETMSTERILIEIWEGSFYGDNPVNKTISILRSRIGDDSRNPRYIETVSKVGYRLIASVDLPEDYRGVPSDRDRWTKGSPYVGLLAFDNAHAKVFRGRGGVVTDLLKAMRNQIDNRNRFVLIVGSSGCGKTSLLRAGVIPKITESSGVDGLKALSIASCDLAAAQPGDMLSPLASALATWTLDGRPVMPPQTPEQLRQLLDETPEVIQGYVDEAFRRCSTGEYDRQPHAHLLLTIDHAEALVATNGANASSLNTFARALQALCACPRVLTTMLARLDYYPKLSEALPVLADLKAGGGHVEVFTPRYGEIAEIIRRPAWQADLSFEKHPETQMRLDDVLRDATRSQPDALPLLQHTLQTLYEQRTEQGMLTFAAYDAIGGLEGAIAHRAEEVFSALPADAQKSLDGVFAKLINLKFDDDLVSGGRADPESFDVNARVLIDAFIEARLFVGSLQKGRPIVGVVHEALLRQWPRAADWADDNRRLLQARARLERSADRWIEEGRRDDHLLNPGMPLSEAQQVAQHLGVEIRVQESQFLFASERVLRIKNRLRLGVMTTLLILTIASSASAYLAFSSKKETEATIASLVKQADAFRAISEIVFLNSNMTAAEPAFKKATETLKSAVEKNPKSEDLLFEYAISTYWLGNLYLQKSDLKRAREQWEIYLRSCKKLLEISPDSSAWERELSYAYTNIGNLDLREKRPEEAIENFKKSLKIKNDFLLEGYSDPTSIVEYSDTLSWIGSTEESLGIMESASTRYEGQIQILRPLITNSVATEDHRRQYANALWRSARIFAFFGKYDLAESHIQESAQTLDEIVSSGHGGDIYKKDLANALLESSYIHTAQRKIVESRNDIEFALKTIESISMSEDSPQTWLRLRETIRFRSAIQGSEKKRGESMKSAIANLEALSIAYPDQQQIAVDIARARISRGIEYSEIGQKFSAADEFKAAITALAPFVKESKDHSILEPWIMANEFLGYPERTNKQKTFLIMSGYRPNHL